MNREMLLDAMENPENIRS
ncbi:hypothetical protein ACVXHB_13605 [Escherichia coli]